MATAKYFESRPVASRLSRSYARLLIVGLLLVNGAAEAQKLSPDLAGRNPNAAVNVIVQFNTVPTQRHNAALKKAGGQINSQLPIVKGVAATIPAGKLAKLASDRDVMYISFDRTVHGALNNTVAPVNANYAWNLGLDGSAVGVAVVDSGINGTHEPDLNLLNSNKSRITYNANFVPWEVTTADLYGHGTHVAGILAGNGVNSTGPIYTETFNGIAPNALLINLRALDRNGVGTDTTVISAIQAAINLKSQYNIRVLNLSLGRPVFESYLKDPLCRAVEQAWKNGIVVVVAAGNGGRENQVGNNGYGTITAPGNDPYAITVGAMKSMGTATRADDLVASYSSKGPTLIDHIVKPDLVAPGNEVTSIEAGSLPKTYPANRVPVSTYSTSNSNAAVDYFVLSGTSMAAPVVSGAAALLIQQNPALAPDQVKARLMKSAYKTFPRYSTATDPATGITYSSQYDVFTVGAGYLDIQAALASSDTSALSAKSPTAYFDSRTQSVYLLRDFTAIWGWSGGWTSSAVWGTSVFSSGQQWFWLSPAVWGSSAVWGTSSSTTAFSALWGTSAVWGTSTNPNATSTMINGEK